MGNRLSHVVGCFHPASHDRSDCLRDPAFDEGLGHSFCYVRPSVEALHLSPSHSDRYTSSGGIDSSDIHISSFRSDRRPIETVAFRAISGASVSANASTPHTILSHEQFHSFTNVPDDHHAAFESTASFASLPLQPVPRGATFSGPVSTTYSGPMSGHNIEDRGFMFGTVQQQQRGCVSGPMERGFMSGPIERGYMSGPIDVVHMDNNRYSAPLAGPYKQSRRRNISRLLSSIGKPVKGAITTTISSSLAHTHRSIVVPVRQFFWRHIGNGPKEAASLYDSSSQLRYVSSDADRLENGNLQWAQAKAGEDRVHVVVSEEHGWLFVGIYDGFNGPDAPDFLMSNLYKSVYKELQGLLWGAKDISDESKGLEDKCEERSCGTIQSPESTELNKPGVTAPMEVSKDKPDVSKHGDSSKDTHSCSPTKVKKCGLTRSRTLKEYLEIAQTEVGTPANGANQKQGGWELATPNLAIKKEGPLVMEMPGFTCNHSNCDGSLMGYQADTVLHGRASDCTSSSGEVLGNKDLRFTDNWTANDHVRRRPLVWPGKILSMPRLRHNQGKRKESHRKLLPQRYAPQGGSKAPKRQEPPRGQLWRDGALDHDAVLAALARALEITEEAYLDMADRALAENPELGLMGSCVLIGLIKGKDVYILNVGDSRAILAQQKKKESIVSSSSNAHGVRDGAVRQDLECIVEDGSMSSALPLVGPPFSSTSLDALQLSMDHSTNIEEEVLRIKCEHPDDNMCIVNDRVKGRLKVTRAFGAGCLKKPRWNDAVLKMFQIDYVGSAPYIICAPALHHHTLRPEDRFLILSSDGLYQYFSNEEVVSYVEWFMEKFPDGDPAQYLIEELLFRAAKKYGMDFHELLDIPQGDRRKYHDDVLVIVVSLDGRVWSSAD